MPESGLSSPRWVRIDLHIHTPASEDYAEPNATYLDILHEAERHNLEVIAITDHNTVAGYEQMRREVDFLAQMVRMGRANAVDQEQYAEYTRLLGRITVLPGFEFTSHYGAHVLGVFPPQTPISLIEATLLQLGVPAEKIKAGATSIPDTEHVTNAYELIAKAGGLVIAAHANTAGGVITESLRMGSSGQSRVAATQSAYLHALEFVNFYTDHGTFTNPAFYNGRTEHYERRMFCIQGSDAHRVRRAPTGSDAAHRHGIGDRYFEALLPAPTFADLRELLLSQRFEHVRVPKRDQKEWEIDQLRLGVASERNVLRSAHAAIEDLLKDVAALANAGGGTIVLGASTTEQGDVEGITQPDQLSERLRVAAAEAIEPAPALSFELLRYSNGDVLRVEVRAVQPPPYLVRGGVIHVRRDCETVPATRGEILQLARRAFAEGATSPLDNGQELSLPRSGVEVVSAQRRNGEWQYEIRDLRTTPGIVRERAQGLWAYAIDRHEDLREGRVDLQAQIKWAGRLGLWRSYRQGNRTKYDLVHRDANGVIDHVFFGVSDWGLSEAWQVLLDNTPPAVELPDEGSDGAVDEMVRPSESRDQGARPAAGEPTFGDRRCRWHASMGIWGIYRTPTGEPRFDLATRGAGGIRELSGLTRNQLNESWLQLITIRRPATGIEVLADAVGDDGVRRITFRDLRTGDVSAPWQVDELKEGSVREYAARMSQLDLSLDDRAVRWWGNIGYLRPMRSQVDLVYRDAAGVDHIYYAARRDELGEHWAALLGQWDDTSPTHAPARAGGGHPGGERRETPLGPRGRPANGRGAPELESWVSGDQGDIVRSSLDGYAPTNTPSHQPDPDA